MGDVGLAEIVLGTITSGGLLYGAFQHWIKVSTAKTQAQLALQESKAKTDQKIQVQTSAADIKGGEDFREKITGKVMEQFLAQFNSYQGQNEKFQSFFFDSLDPMIAELRDNTQDVRNVLTQIDLLARGTREVTAAVDKNSACLDCLCRLLSQHLDIPLPSASESLTISPGTTNPVSRRQVVASADSDIEPDSPS
jgi:hypothetical protein